MRRADFRKGWDRAALKKHFRKGSIVLFGLTCLIVCGCLTGRPARNIEQYVLEYSPPGPVNSPLKAGLMVERFHAAQNFLTTAMIFQPEPFRQEAYNYHRWRVPPADLVMDYLTRDLRSARLFQAVFAYDDSIEARFVLEGEVTQFLEVDEKGGPSAVLGVSLTVLGRTQGEIDKRVVFQKDYLLSEPMDAPSPHALAQGLSGAMSRISAELIGDLDQALKLRISE